MSTKHFPGLSHYLVLAIALVSLLTLLIPVTVVRADEVVTFPDPKLEAAIRTAINKPSGDIYQSDLDGLTALNLTMAGVTNLSGLEHCTSLTWLDIVDCQISDISALSSLTSLTYLTVAITQVSDISPLAGLTSLTMLQLGWNEISDISPLSGLTGLTLLGLNYNQITDISPLAGLTSLTRLALNMNQIKDISALSGLTMLTDYLYIDNNQISDISALSGLTKLTQLFSNNNQISDISLLSGLTSLTYLQLSGNQISNVSPLSGLTKLTMLDLYRNEITDIRPLVDNPGLSTGDNLFLKDNPLSAMSVYGYIPQLQARGVYVEYSPYAGNTYQVATATGTGTAVLASASGTIQNLTAVSEATLPTAGKPDLQFPHGFFEFQVTGLTAGQSVDLTIILPSAAPVGTQYWKYGPTQDNNLNHWYQLPMGSDNGDNVITITLVDGGLGDDDLTANGGIVDQGGPGNSPAGGRGVPVFPSIYIGICIAFAAGILAYFARRRAMAG